MIYEYFDVAYAALTPARLSARIAKTVFGHPLSPFAYGPVGRSLNAAASVFSGAAKRRPKPAWNIAATIEVVDDRPFGRLIHFNGTFAGERPRVLLVAPLSGHYATLLRGTVERLLTEHDVYVTDWKDARDVPVGAGRFDLDDYIGYVIDYLRLLGPDVHVIAVCQPAPAVLSAVAIMAAAGDPAQPRSMVLMGGPIDARAAQTAPTKFAASRPLKWFARNVTTKVPLWYPGAGRRVYPGMLQLTAFIAMNRQKHTDAQLAIYNDLVRGNDESASARQRFYDEYFSVMDVPAEYYLQTLDRVFQRHALATGTMTWRGQRVDPGAIQTTALMTIEGEFDDISAPGQTVAAHALCSAIPAERREHLLQKGVGHYGIFNGRSWRAEIAPRIATFIRKQ